MKKLHHLKNILLLAPITVLVFSCNQPKAGREASFYVRGNCGMCEERIEQSLASVNGVIKADWDVKTKNMVVSYDSTKIDERTIQQKIANAGHETKSISSPQAVHDALPECCKKSVTM